MHNFTSKMIKAATVIVTMLPLLLPYPFGRRYSVKGMMLGGATE